MEKYSDIRNNEFTKFLGKWMELENIILSEVTQSKKEYTWYSLTDNWNSPKGSEYSRYNSHIT